jgi:hypothetical protein
MAEDGEWREAPASQPTVDAQGRVCAKLPSSKRASKAHPAAFSLEIATDGRAVEAGAARVHVYQQGPESYLLAGLERVEP